MKKKVLLVDDNKDLRYAIVKGMEVIAPDIQIIEADSGENALFYLKNGKFDAILLDIMMPTMDGWDVAAKIKADPNLDKIPLLFLTAKTDEYSKGVGRVTADDYIEKPIKIEDLKKRLEKFLKK